MASPNGKAPSIVLTTIAADQLQVKVEAEGFKSFWVVLFGEGAKPTTLSCFAKAKKLNKPKLALPIGALQTCDKGALRDKKTQQITGYSVVLKSATSMYVLASENEAIIDKFFEPLSKLIKKRAASKDGGPKLLVKEDKRSTASSEESGSRGSAKSVKSPEKQKAKKPREVTQLVPANITMVLDHLLSNGALRVEGIGRISGLATTVSFLAGELSDPSFSPTLFEGENVHTIISSVKRNLRELKPPLLDTALYREVAAGLAKDALPSRKILACKKLLMQIAPDVQTVIRNIATFSILVANRKKDTLMGLDNMAIIWGPTVFVSPSTAGAISDTGTGLTAMKTLLDCYGYVWDVVPDDDGTQDPKSLADVRFKGFVKGDPDSEYAAQLLAQVDIAVPSSSVKSQGSVSDSDELKRMLEEVDSSVSTSVSDSDSSAIDLEAE